MADHPKFLDSRLQTSLFHPIHPTDMLEGFLAKVDTYDIVIFLSEDEGYKWPAAERIQKELISTRSLRWPSADDAGELRLDNSLLRKLEKAVNKFEFVDSIYVENDRFFKTGLFVNIYANKMNKDKKMPQEYEEI